MKFSVLMANYNKGRYIKEAIESVIKQSYSRWELVIVDDFSDDSSMPVIKKFLRDQRIKLIRHKKNLGCGASKRACAENSQGSIMGILDSDDCLHPLAIEKILDVYRRSSEINCVYSNYYECDSRLWVQKISSWVGPYDSALTNLKKNFSSHFFTFTRHAYEKTGGFDPRQKRAVDKDIIYKIEEKAKPVFVNRPLYYYRMDERGISLGKNEQAASGYKILAQYNAFKRRTNSRIPNLSAAEISGLLLAASIKFLFSGEPLMSIKSFYLSFKTKPFNFRGYINALIKVMQQIKHIIWLKHKKRN